MTSPSDDRQVGQRPVPRRRGVGEGRQPRSDLAPVVGDDSLLVHEELPELAHVLDDVGFAQLTTGLIVVAAVAISASGRKAPA